MEFLDVNRRRLAAKWLSTSHETVIMCILQRAIEKSTYQLRRVLKSALYSLAGFDYHNIMQSNCCYDCYNLIRQDIDQSDGAVIRIESSGHLYFPIYLLSSTY